MGVKAVMYFLGEEASETVVVGSEVVEGEGRVDGGVEIGVFEGIGRVGRGGGTGAVPSGAVWARNGVGIVAMAVRRHGEGMVVDAEEVGEWGGFDVVCGVAIWEDGLYSQMEGVKGTEGGADSLL